MFSEKVFNYLDFIRLTSSLSCGQVSSTSIFSCGGTCLTSCLSFSVCSRAFAYSSSFCYAQLNVAIKISVATIEIAFVSSIAGNIRFRIGCIASSGSFDRCCASPVSLGDWIVRWCLDVEQHSAASILLSCCAVSAGVAGSSTCRIGVRYCFVASCHVGRFCRVYCSDWCWTRCTTSGWCTNWVGLCVSSWGTWSVAVSLRIAKIDQNSQQN